MISLKFILGAVIIFTALLSVAFLGSTIRKVMWAGIFVILVGLALVGISDIIFGSDSAQTDTNGIIAGKGGYSYIKKVYPSIYRTVYAMQVTGICKRKFFHVYISSAIFFHIGDLLIIMAQIIAAVQMVYEEKFVTRYSVPAMQAVGWEGTKLHS